GRGGGKAGKEKGPGADRRLEIVVPLARVVGVLEGELGEGEQIVVASPLLDAQPVQPFEGRLGIPPEELGQVPAVEDVLAEEARGGGVQRTLCQLAADDPGRHAADPDGRAAGDQPPGSHEQCCAGREDTAHQAGDPSSGSEIRRRVTLTAIYEVPDSVKRWSEARSDPRSVVPQDPERGSAFGAHRVQATADR